MKLSLNIDTFIKNRLEEKGILRRGSCKGFPIEACSEFMKNDLGISFVEEYLSVLLAPYPWESMSRHYEQNIVYMKEAMDASFTKWVISIYEKSKDL